MPAIALGAASVAMLDAPTATSWLAGLEPGMCFDDAFDARGDFDLSVPARVVTCDGPHDNEIAARIGLGEVPYPGGDEGANVDERCAPRYEAFLGRPIESTLMAPFSIWPDEADWAAGTHDALCVVYAGGPVAVTAASASLRVPGEMLAVLGEVGEKREIFLVDGADGSVRDATDDDLTELLGPPAWTPDGGAIAFAAETGDDDSDIFLAPLDGSEASLLIDSPAEDGGPSFSPDGSTLAYISDVDADEFELYALDLASGTSTRLTIHPDRDSSARWSPDSSRIAFRRRTNGQSDIWVMNAGGSDPQHLSDNGANNCDPRWSPDGSRLLFTTDQPGDFDIRVMNADGSDARALTAHPADDEYPAWSSDGQFIAFHSSRHGGISLWLMRADGSEQSELTGVAPLGYPAFAPASSDRPTDRPTDRLAD